MILSACFLTWSHTTCQRTMQSREQILWEISIYSIIIPKEDRSCLCSAPVWSRSGVIVTGSCSNVWPVFPQEGSGFEDFDSDDEVLRVSELLLDLHQHHLLFFLQAQRPVDLPRVLFFLSRGRRVLVDPQACRGPQDLRLKTSSLDRPVLLGEMAGTESAAPPAHL